MNFSPQILLGCLLYFGALVVPALYFLFAERNAKARTRMLIGVGLQVFGSIAVAAFAYFSWRAGHKDALMVWGLLLPVNLISFIYFLAVLFVCRKKDKK